MDWFHALYEGRESFDSVEEERAYRAKQSSLTAVEARELFSLLDLRDGELVLDLFCGNGRHSVEMASLGVRCVGVDVARSRVSFAHRWARDAGARAHFLLGDAARLPLRGSACAVLILGGSFSHCGIWDKDVELLTALRDVLRPGGRLLIDNPNPVRFWSLRNPAEELPDPQALPWFDLPLTGGPEQGRVRYWGVYATRRLFEEAGYTSVRILGDRRGGTYTAQSPRLVAVGEVPETG